MSTKKPDVFIDNLDKEYFSQGIEVIKEDKVYLQEIADKLTGEFTSTIDKLMQEIYRAIKANRMDDKAIESYFLELTNLIYFLGDKCESLGLELTVSSARNQEIFNRLYLEAQGTIPEKKATATEGTKYEALMVAVYESVSKRIKAKIEAAYEMVSSLKRIIVKRCAEMDLTKKTSNYNGGGPGGGYQRPGRRNDDPFGGE